MILAPSIKSPIARPHLSPRQFQVLRGMAAGLTTREIADQLGISLRTACRYRTGLLERLGVRCGCAAVDLAHKLGLL